ncbi:unnamed protein product [Acanthoscelides obtectus]|uniref:C2H2-type domain-containing protein n=1 Tax=Acanthoscelides obtectus TaxID=200917 RepID=A0A9P0MK72_ACAOB|nr:unnamed protein product [Acanthoscelides obtectus]CAK1682489.1 hypothetical protein AOBTE_LOCUS33669 [Acanthoscelides obtectus]
MFQCPKCQRTFTVRKSLLRHSRERCSQDGEPASKRPCNATASRSTADKCECPRCQQKFSAGKGLLRHGREVCTSGKSPPEQQRVEASITQTTTGLKTRRLDPSTANVAVPGPNRLSPTTSNDSQTSAESRTIRCDSCNCEVPRNAHAAHLKSIKHKAHLWTPLHNNVSHQYSDKVSLAYTDTDSLIVHVEADNFYEDMKSHMHHFDTSNYDADNPHNMPLTASKLGKMKDEYGGKVLSAFYGTRPKAYCIDAVDQVAKRNKSISKASVKHQLHLLHYKDFVEEKRTYVYCTIYVFKSESHNIYTNYIRKVTLTSMDDKRFLIPNSTKTLAWGHQDITFHNMSDGERLDLLLRLMNEASELTSDQMK